MRKSRLFALLVAFLALIAPPAFAQTVAPTPVQPSYLTTTGCPSVNLTPCVFPFSGGFNAIVSNTPVVQNAAYSASNAIGGFQQIAVFRNAGQPSGIIDYVSVASKGGSTTALTIYAFNKSSANLTSTCTDKSAFALTAADLTALIPGFPVTLTPATTQGATITSASQSIVVSVKNADATPSTNITLCAVVGGSVTPASVSDLVFNIALVQD